MKKSIIAAGAASLALAAMPMAGVFAAKASDPAAITDVLTVNIEGICTFERTTGSGQYTQTMLANAVKTDFGSSTFTVICNNHTGYDIAAVFGTLSGPGDNIAYSATTPTAGSGTWTAKLHDAADNLAASGAKIAEAASEDPAGGSTYTVDYIVSTKNNQAQGTYTNASAAVYTLTQNS